MSFKHGDTKHSGPNHVSREYETWCAMKKRCYNPKARQFRWYGARGIKVCERWKDSYKNFLEDMGRRPDPKSTINRLDNDKDYEPSNCVWANRKVQGAHKRSTKYLTHSGLTLSYSEWERHLGLTQGRVSKRLCLGWSLERVLSK